MFQVHLALVLSWVASGWCRLTSWAVLFVSMMCVAWATPLQSPPVSGTSVLAPSWRGTTTTKWAAFRTRCCTATVAPPCAGGDCFRCCAWPRSHSCLSNQRQLCVSTANSVWFGGTCAVRTRLWDQLWDWARGDGATGRSPDCTGVQCVLWGQPWDQTSRIRPHRSDTAWTWKGFVAVCVCVSGETSTLAVQRFDGGAVVTVLNRLTEPINAKSPSHAERKKPQWSQYWVQDCLGLENWFTEPVNTKSCREKEASVVAVLSSRLLGAGKLIYRSCNHQIVHRQTSMVAVPSSRGLLGTWKWVPASQVQVPVISRAVFSQAENFRTKTKWQWMELVVKQMLAVFSQPWMVVTWSALWSCELKHGI